MRRAVRTLKKRRGKPALGALPVGGTELSARPYTTIMMQLSLEKLPGGDASRKRTLARITLTNTGDGAGGVRVYRVKFAEGEPRVSNEVRLSETLTHREEDEGALRLVYRALGKLLGESD